MYERDRIEMQALQLRQNARTRDGSRTERNRKQVADELEDSRVNIWPASGRDGGTKQATSRRIWSQTCEGKKPIVWLHSDGPTTRHNNN